jgi:hypothetical protein
MGRYLLALVVVLVALVAAGCGSDDDESDTSTTAAWAEDFCTSVTDWDNELEQIADELVESPSREGLEDAAQQAEDATDSFIQEVRDLGGPETESGQAVDDSLEQLADTVDEQKAAIEEAVDEADGLTGAAGAVSAIGTSISTMATALQTALQAIEDEDASGELKTAFEDTPACDELTNGDETD